MLNFPILVKKIDMQIQEAHRVPNKIHAQRPTPRHMKIKMPKVKDEERILKAARKKALSYLQGSSHNTSFYFSKETLHTRRDWQEMAKVVKSRDLEPRSLTQQSYHLELKGR